MQLSAEQFVQFVSASITPRLATRDTELLKALAELTIVRTSGERLPANTERLIVFRYSSELQPRAEIVADAFEEILEEHDVAPSDTEAGVIQQLVNTMFARTRDELTAGCINRIGEAMSEDSSSMLKSSAEISGNYLTQRVARAVRRLQRAETERESLRATQRGNRWFDVLKLILAGVVSVTLVEGGKTLYGRANAAHEATIKNRNDIQVSLFPRFDSLAVPLEDMLARWNYLPKSYLLSLTFQAFDLRLLTEAEKRLQPANQQIRKTYAVDSTKLARDYGAATAIEYSGFLTSVDSFLVTARAGVRVLSGQPQMRDTIPVLSTTDRILIIGTRADSLRRRIRTFQSRLVAETDK
jgi:hypothetical protein